MSWRLHVSVFKGWFGDYVAAAWHVALKHPVIFEASWKRTSSWSQKIKETFHVSQCNENDGFETIMLLYSTTEKCTEPYFLNVKSRFFEFYSLLYLWLF